MPLLPRVLHLSPSPHHGGQQETGSNEANVYFRSLPPTSFGLGWIDGFWTARHGRRDDRDCGVQSRQAMSCGVATAIHVNVQVDERWRAHVVMSAFKLIHAILLCSSLFSVPAVVNCTEPGHVENSIRQILPSGPHRYSFQTTVSYSCNPGYYLLGTSSISCQGDGTWDRSLPKCLCEYTLPEELL